jgi:LDH2 family malate/lactate/ureidoglycolate dehydrogenase
MMEKMIRFRKRDLHDYAVRFMERFSVPAPDAEIVADVLVAADLRGIPSHGFIRLHSYYGHRLAHGYMKPQTDLKVISETATTLTLDGGNGLGQVAGRRAMERCIEKAKTADLAVGVVHRSNHYGIAGYYAMMALEHGMIGVSLTNSHPLVAPTYGRTAAVGTNPISVAIPSGKEFPFVLDMATSTVTIGRVTLHEKMGKPIPLGWGIDSAGNPTDDPLKILGDRGALLPLGGADITAGYKGYGLGLLVDILCATLSGGRNLTDVGGPEEARESDVSHLFMALRVDAFRPLAAFADQMDRLVETLKSLPRIEGQDRIYVAGEKEYENVLQNERLGVPIPEPAIVEIRREGEKAGVPFDLVPVSGEKIPGFGAG